MSKIFTENESNKHLILDSLTVRNIKNGQVKEITQNVEAIRHAQETMAEQTQNYWADLAKDGIITPAEKRILYKEWKIIQTEYAALIEDAAASGLAESSQELINYKKEYQFLYNYLITDLKLFDDMSVVTELLDREVFIQKYDNYYSSRDKLRIAITDGEMADIENGLQGQIDHVKEDLAGVTQGGVADGSITVDKLASDIQQDFRDFEDAAAVGFITDDILGAIDTADLAVKEELSGIINKNDTKTSLMFEAMGDRITTLIDDANKKTRSRVSQTQDEFTVQIVDFQKEVATQFQQTADAINLMATDLRAETTAGIKVQADRITDMVQAGNTDAYMSLSVGIPYFLTQSRYDDWKNKLTGDESGLTYLDNIYEKKNTGTEAEPVYWYVMRDTATQTEVASLTNKMRALDALSSQIVLSADMIQIDGQSIFTSNNTINQAYVDYTGYATESNLNTVGRKADSAWDKSNSAMNIANYTGHQINNFINAILEDPSKWSGTTIIDGGLIKTDLIDAQAIITKMLSADEIILGTSLKSNNYISSHGVKGFNIDGVNGNVAVNDGTFRGDITTVGLQLKGFKAGNVLVRELGECPGNTKGYSLVKNGSFYWQEELDVRYETYATQFAGTGTLKVVMRVNITGYPDTEEGTGDFYGVGMYRGKPDGTVTLINNYSGPKGTRTITSTIDVTAGDYIIFIRAGYPGGRPVVWSESYIKYVKFYVESRNDLLSYLGEQLNIKSKEEWGI